MKVSKLMCVCVCDFPHAQTCILEQKEAKRTKIEIKPCMIH